MKFFVLIFNIIVYRNIFIIWYLIKVCESCEDKKNYNNLWIWSGLICEDKIV